MAISDAVAVRMFALDMATRIQKMNSAEDSVETALAFEKHLLRKVKKARGR